MSKSAKPQASPVEVESTTFGLGSRCSVQLSYEDGSALYSTAVHASALSMRSTSLPSGYARRHCSAPGSGTTQDLVKAAGVRPSTHWGAAGDVSGRRTHQRRLGVRNDEGAALGPRARAASHPRRRSLAAGELWRPLATWRFNSLARSRVVLIPAQQKQVVNDLQATRDHQRPTKAAAP